MTRDPSAHDKVLAGVLLFMIVGGVFLTMGCTQEKDVQDTPKSTFKEYVDRVNKRQGEKALELTDAQFLKDNESLADIIDGVERSIDNGEMVLSDYEDLKVVWKGEMTERNRSKTKELLDWYENETDIKIQDHCLIRLDVPSRNGTKELTFPMIKVEGDWYLGWLGHMVVILPNSGVIG